jgi:hypothetical protein
MTAHAFGRAPYWTTATKLLPLVPYQRFVLSYARAPNDASEPHCAEVKGTGKLRLGVVEMRRNAVIQTLEAIDFAPRDPPAAEIGGQPVHGLVKREEFALGRYESGVTLDFSRPGKPTDNAFVESFNGLRRTPDLDRNRYDRCPSRCVVALVIEHHPHRSLANFRRILVRCLACHRSTFSGDGASGKPGAVHSQSGGTLG